MILRRLKTHVEAENWFAVAIDFLIVVCGVFIGVQLGNWNDTRMDRQSATNALERLRGEIVANIHASETMVARIDASFETRDTAIKALETCEHEPDGVQAIELAIALMQSDIVPPLVSNMTDELSRQERHTAFLTPGFLSALNRHNGEINHEVNQLMVNFGLMWDRHIIDNPKVGLSAEGADVGTVRVTIEDTFDALCEDNTFKRDLIMTNVLHASTRLRLDRFKGWSEDFLQTLDAELAGMK